MVLSIRNRWVAAIACALAALPAAAQETQRFDLPEQDAAKAVQAIARQSGLQVMAPAADLVGIRTNAVQGNYSAVEAIERLFAGTGLQVVQTGDNTVTIRRPAEVESASEENSARAVETAEPVGLNTKEVIIVTGSRIRRPGFDTLEAALVTDAGQIERRGYTNIIQALDDTPGFVASDVNPVGTTQGTFNAGQSFANFFGLGSQRTLTLVNGRRFVSSNTISGSGGAAAPGQQVDLNLIPVGLVERVETIAIGGAPVYGADAIAGTVNVILKDDYEGFEGTAQYGLTEAGDAESYTVRVLGGLNFAEGRGNVALGAEYNDQRGIRLSERTGRHEALPNLLGDPAFLVTDDLVLSSMTEAGLPYNPATFGNIVDASGTPLQFQGGDLVPFITGDPLNGLIAAGFTDGGDGVPFADHMSLLTPTERILVSGLGHYDLTSDVRLITEIAYARSEGREISDLAAFSSPFINGTVIPVSVDNPFISADARSTLLANGVTGTFFLGRNLSDLLERDNHLFENTINMFRAVAGVEGDFTLFDNRASWDVSVNYGRSRALTLTTYIDNDRFLEAVDAVTDAATGDIVCASGNPGCVPLDIFGIGAFSDAAAEYATDRGSAVSLNQQRVATANLNGSLPFRISTDPIGFNIGAQYRKESGSFDPDPLLSRDYNLFGFTYASAYQGDAGSYSTNEVYGELSAPLISDEQRIPVVKSLSADAAIRYVDNSITGGDVTWSAGGRFAPRLPGIGDGLMLRGVYTEAIRAPAITELFSGSSPTRGGIDDPCSVINFQQGPNPAVREANCRAALDELGITPETFSPTTFALSAIGTISGNPELENEQAESWSAGIVYQPESIQGLRLSLDWSEIELTGGIESLSIGTLIEACYDSPDFPNLATCDAFRRLPAGETGPGSPNPVRVTGDIADGYRSGYVNVASLDFAGLIVAAEYGFGLWDFGAMQLGAKLFHNDKFVVRATDSSPIIDEVGGVGLPDWSGQFNVGYARARFELALQALWTDSVKNDILAGTDLLAPSENNIDSYWRFNGTAGFNFNERTRLQLVVNNLFDKEPSQAALFSGSYGTYDLLGRRFLVSATVGF